MWRAAQEKSGENDPTPPAKGSAVNSGRDPEGAGRGAGPRDEAGRETEEEGSQ